MDETGGHESIFRWMCVVENKRLAVLHRSCAVWKMPSAARGKVNAVLKRLAAKIKRSAVKKRRDAVERRVNAVWKERHAALLEKRER